MNAYLEEFLTDTESQETAPLPADEIMDIIYQSMPTTWKNKVIEKGFNYAGSAIKETSDFFETRVKTWSPRKIRKNLQQMPRNPSRKPRREKYKILTPESYSPAKNGLKLAAKGKEKTLTPVL